jgi:hypothetical protein
MENLSLLSVPSPQQAPLTGRKPTPFILFPREIRDAIYKYALVSSNRVTAISRPFKTIIYCDPIAGLEISAPYSLAEYKPPSPSLLLVNRQIHAEALPLLYGHNIFSFSNATHLSSFAAQIGAHCALVRKLEITINYLTMGRQVVSHAPSEDLYFGERAQDWEEALGELSASFTGLEEMTISTDCLTSREGKDVLDHGLLRALTLFWVWRGERFRPRVVLRGWKKGEGKKFPTEWQVLERGWATVWNEKYGESDEAEEEEGDGARTEEAVVDPWRAARDAGESRAYAEDDERYAW